MNRGRRLLPGLPFGPDAIGPAFVPPPAPMGPASAMPGGNVTDRDAEVIQVSQLAWPDRALTVAASTANRWRACDVFVSLQNMATDAALSVLVYGVTGTSRALVASGRLGPGVNYSIPGNVGPGGQLLIASVRAQAQKFEVVVHGAGWPAPPAIAPSPRVVDVTVVASNDANEPPAGVGEAFAFASMQDGSAPAGVGGGTYFDTAGGTEALFPLPELRGFSAVNLNSASPLFFLVGSYVAAQGASPTASPRWHYAFPIGTAGQGLSGDFVYRLKGTNSPLDGSLTCGVSTSATALVPPAVGAAAFNVIVR